MKINSELDNSQNEFAWYGKSTNIHKLRTSRCEIYPITTPPKKIDDQKQEGSFMGYANITATVKLWYPHTQKLKYCLYAKFDQHNNKFI